MTRFEELLTMMTATQKNNKSGWMDPSNDWEQIGGYDTPKDAVNSRKQGKRVTGCLQKGALP